MTTLQDTIDKAKADFLQSKARLTHALATTPDDRINWSPSPTARTPLQAAAHAVASIKNIHDMLDGRPFPIATTAEADAAFLEWERQFTTRESVINLLEQNSAKYLEWLDALTPERLSSMVEAPFGLGYVPVAIGLAFVPAQIQGHVAQIDYIQTIYGDRDWHL